MSVHLLFAKCLHNCILLVYVYCGCSHVFQWLATHTDFPVCVFVCICAYVCLCVWYKIVTNLLLSSLWACYQNLRLVFFQHQYIFIHDVILESVVCGDTQVEAGDLRKRLAQLNTRDRSGNTGMDLQFAVMCIHTHTHLSLLSITVCVCNIYRLWSKSAQMQERQSRLQQTTIWPRIDQ